MQEFVKSLAKAHAWDQTEFHMDFEQEVYPEFKTGKYFDSVWDAVSQEEIPLERRVALLSIFLEYINVWRTAMQTSQKNREYRLQVLSSKVLCTSYFLLSLAISLRLRSACCSDEAGYQPKRQVISHIALQKCADFRQSFLKRLCLYA